MQSETASRADDALRVRVRPGWRIRAHEDARAGGITFGEGQVVTNLHPESAMDFIKIGAVEVI